MSRHLPCLNLGTCSHLPRYCHSANRRKEIMKITRGHGSPSEGGCWMVAASMYNNEGWHDHPECVPPTIRALCIALNDMLPDGERERVIGQYLFHPMGRDGSHESEMARATLCAEWAVRRYALTHESTRDWATKWLSVEDRSYDAAVVAARSAAAVAASLAARSAREAWLASRSAGPAWAVAAAARLAAWAARSACEEAAASGDYESLLQLILDCCAIGTPPDPICKIRAAKVALEVCGVGGEGEGMDGR